MSTSKIYAPLLELCSTLVGEANLIPTERKEKLNELVHYFSDKYQKGLTPKATVICTHNSRRSHMGQLWLSVAGAYFNLPPLETYSGGTDITAFNPRAVQALKKVGFEIAAKDPTIDNPVYQIRWKKEMDPYAAFSKKYDDTPNPKEDFAAIMVCSSADQGCPFVSGSDLRLALPFDDPKAFDETPLEAAKYEERCRDIGREILYVFSQVVV